MLFSINASEKKTICSYNAAYMQDFETMLYKVFACTSLSVISMYKQTVFTLMSPSTSSEELELMPKALHSGTCMHYRIARYCSKDAYVITTVCEHYQF